MNEKYIDILTTGGDETTSPEIMKYLYAPIFSWGKEEG